MSPGSKKASKKARGSKKAQGSDEAQTSGRDAKRRTSTTRRKILVVSGPCLDRLGTREPEIYGGDTLDDVHEACRRAAEELGATTECRQSNHEGELVTWLSRSQDENFVGIVLNGGAYTHTSIALYDALRASGLPAVEVHLSHPASREGFRRRSRIAPACVGLVTGFGLQSYVLGIKGLIGHIGALASSSGETANATGDKRVPMAL